MSLKILYPDDLNPDDECPYVEIPSDDDFTMSLELLEHVAKRVWPDASLDEIEVTASDESGLRLTKK